MTDIPLKVQRRLSTQRIQSDSDIHVIQRTGVPGVCEFQRGYDEPASQARLLGPLVRTFIDNGRNTIWLMLPKRLEQMCPIFIQQGFSFLFQTSRSHAPFHLSNQFSYRLRSSQVKPSRALLSVVIASAVYITAQSRTK